MYHTAHNVERVQQSDVHRHKRERQGVCIHFSYVLITDMISTWNDLKFLELQFLHSFFLFLLLSLFFFFSHFLEQSEISVRISSGWSLWEPSNCARFQTDGLVYYPSIGHKISAHKGVYNWIESFPRDHRDSWTQVAMKSTKQLTIYPFIWEHQPKWGKNAKNKPYPGHPDVSAP